MQYNHLLAQANSERVRVQLGCINANLIGYEAYKEVVILHCWSTIEAAWIPVLDEFYLAIRSHNMQYLTTLND